MVVASQTNNILLSSSWFQIELLRMFIVFSVWCLVKGLRLQNYHVMPKTWACPRKVVKMSSYQTIQRKYTFTFLQIKPRLSNLCHVASLHLLPIWVKEEQQLYMTKSRRIWDIFQQSRLIDITGFGINLLLSLQTYWSNENRTCVISVKDTLVQHALVWENMGTHWKMSKIIRRVSYSNGGNMGCV